MSNHLIPCSDAADSIILFIDRELTSPEQYQVLELHFAECQPCLAQMERERATITLMQSLLRNTCNEAAPIELLHNIQATINTLAANTATAFFSQTTITEFTFDCTTSIAITQEFTQEIRHEFPGE